MKKGQDTEQRQRTQYWRQKIGAT